MYICTCTYVHTQVYTYTYTHDSGAPQKIAVLLSLLASYVALPEHDGAKALDGAEAWGKCLAAHVGSHAESHRHEDARQERAV